MTSLRLLCAVCALFFLAACNTELTQAEIVNKGRDADTRAELQSALGDPDKIRKLGPIETWTYAASDGSVSFLLAGDMVTTSSTSSEKIQ